VFKLETDKVVFALGGVILGFGILEILERVGARWDY
jgi:hypothetical protein